MTESKQESCISKTKKSWSEIYNAPCFLLKIIIYCVIGLLVALGLLTLVRFALDNFNDAISYSYMAPERLGQFGDFLGGTLNPIFGFLTVCLLLWSIFIQRKELSLTRKELKKSAKALNEQVNISKDEYDRKYVLDLLNNYKDKFYSSLYKQSEFSLRFVSKTAEDRFKKGIETRYGNLFEVYRQIISAESVESVRHLLQSLNHPPKTAEYYLIQVIHRTHDKEYQSGHEEDIRPLIDMRNSSIYVAQLTHHLSALNDNQTVEKILFNETFDLLKKQSYFISKEDISFIEALPEIFQSKIRTLIQDRKFDYKPGISLQEKTQDK